MSEFEVKQTRNAREDDLHPVLSLNKTPLDVKKNDADIDEQEALWSRSLECFEQMKAAQAI